MEIMNAPAELAPLLCAWGEFCTVTDIGPIRDDAHYERMSGVRER